MKSRIPVGIKAILAFIAFTGLLAAAGLCRAQTNTPPPQQFYQTVFGYFSSFNTNLSDTFSTDTVDISAGADTVDNANMAASFTVEVLPFRSSSNVLASGLSIESVTRNATVAGILVSEQGGIGWSATHIDTRVTGYVDFGRRFDTSQNYFAPGLRVKKALTDNTFAGVGLELPIYLNSNHGQSSGAPAPTLSIFTGFRF